MFRRIFKLIKDLRNSITSYLFVVPVPKYTITKRVPEESRGKHREVAFVASVSKRSGSIKTWVYKPEDYAYFYAAEDIIKEVFVSNIFVALQGKFHAAKCKFVFSRFGLVSRVLNSHATDLLDYKHVIKKEMVASLIQSMCIGFMLGDRDLCARNFVVVDNDYKKYIYKIDHEWCLKFDSHNVKHVLALMAVINAISRSPMEFILLLHDNSLGWNQKNEILSRQLLLELKDSFDLEDLYSEDIFSNLEYIAEQIKADDWHLLKAVCEKIERDIPPGFSFHDVRFDDKRSTIQAMLTRFVAKTKETVTTISAAVALQKNINASKPGSVVKFTAAEPPRRTYIDTQFANLARYFMPRLAIC